MNCDRWETRTQQISQIYNDSCLSIGLKTLRSVLLGRREADPQIRSRSSRQEQESTGGRSSRQEPIIGQLSLDVSHLSVSATRLLNLKLCPDDHQNSNY